ncbi:MAG: hypothetical protein IPH03_05535 [Tetrasphaera sp.]|jgi:hypothetical protein|nr:hypothetical protein [Tetrasphaera sp.]
MPPKSLDGPSVVALAARLRSLAVELTAATGAAGQRRTDADWPFPAALAADARLAQEAAADLARVVDACGGALSAYAYAAATLDRDHSLLEMEARRHGLDLDVLDVVPSRGVRGLADARAESAARAALGRLRRGVLVLAEERARLDADLRAGLARHTTEAAAIADRLR